MSLSDTTDMRSVLSQWRQRCHSYYFIFHDAFHIVHVTIKFST